MSLLTAMFTWAAGRAAAADEGTFWLPPQSSTLAAEHDWVFYFIYYVDAVFFVLLMGAMFLFFFKYKKKDGGDATVSKIKGNHSLELAWSVLPTFLLAAMFITGFKAYLNQSVPPVDSRDIRVVAQKWSWTFEYPEGFSINVPSRDIEKGQGDDDRPVLVVPAGEPVRLTMSSVDVLHSFFVPDFRIKKDILPNRYTVVWFEAPEPGEHTLYCTEYCGTNHSRMYATIQVKSPEDYAAWIAEQTAKLAGTAVLPADKRGEALFTKNGCQACHSIDGKNGIGPTLKGKYGAQEKLADGTTVTIDDNYLRESIMVPAAKVVEGFAPSMPPFQGRLSDQEVNDLIDYIKTLKD